MHFKITCLHCDEPALESTLRCLTHLNPSAEQLMLDHAMEYAVASILYYKGELYEIMSDARFDGLCRLLLKQKAWEKIPWIEKSMLIAGSGYDLSMFPPEAHAKVVEVKSEGSNPPLVKC